MDSGFTFQNFAGTDIQKYFNIISPWLYNKEHRFSLEISLLNNCVINPAVYSPNPLFLSYITQNSEIILVSFMTGAPCLIHVCVNVEQNSDFNKALIIPSIDLLCEKLAELCIDTTGGIRAEPSVMKFLCEKWKTLHPNINQDNTEIIHERLHCLTEVNENIKQCENKKIRKGTLDDLEIINKFEIIFGREALGEEMNEIGLLRVRKAVENGLVYLLENENNEIVSMARFPRCTKNTVSISGVFTPSNHRGNGYATSMVHSLAVLKLKEGYRYILLYTDLANPISNSIYHKIGFRPIADLDRYIFGKS